jgi:hypothetical protein
MGARPLASIFLQVVARLVFTVAPCTQLHARTYLDLRTGMDLVVVLATGADQPAGVKTCIVWLGWS